MKGPLCVLLVLLSLSLADPINWLTSIPNEQPGNPVVREFQTLVNIPGSSLNVLYGGVTYNGTTLNLNDTWILDTSGGSPVWKFANPTYAPPPRAYTVTGATSSEVILFGGSNEKVPKTFFDDVWRYNISSNSWKQDVFVVPSVLLARSFHAGVLVRDSLYIFGGFGLTLQQVTNDLWSYNITTKQWTLHSANGRSGAPTPRQGHSAVFYNDTMLGPSIIFFGGYNGTGGRSDTWQYVINTTAWIQITKDQDPSGPLPRWGHSAIFVDSPPHLVIFGGSFVGGPINPYYNDVWSLALTSSGSSSWWNWTLELPDGDAEGPWKRGGHSSVLSAGRAFTFAGYGLFVGLYNDLWELVNF